MKTYQKFISESNDLTEKFGVVYSEPRGAGKVPMVWLMSTVTGEMVPVQKGVAKGTKHGSIKQLLNEPGVVFKSAKEIQDLAKTDKILAGVLKKKDWEIQDLRQYESFKIPASYLALKAKHKKKKADKDAKAKKDKERMMTLVPDYV